MLAVVRHLLTFVLYSVLEVHWRSLEKKLITAEGIMGGKDRIETVDQLLRDHVDFLDTCLKECMLSSSRLVKVCFCAVSFLSFKLTSENLATSSPSSDMHGLYLVY